jgi:hypothetical protein
MLSPALRVLGFLDLRAKTDGIAVSPDGKHLGLSLRDRTCVMTTGGEVITEVPHKPWLDWAGGGCTFSPDGRFFWTVRPGGKKRSISVEVTECDGWRVVATVEFKAKEDGGWFLVPHPEGKVVGLWLGAGQDGQWLYWSGIEDGCLHVEKEPSLAATGPPVFHPAGGEFLADDVDEGSLRRHRFPSGEVVGVLSEADAYSSGDTDEDPEELGEVSHYISDDRALILSNKYGIWAVDLGTMRIEGELLLEGRRPKPHRVSGNKKELLYGDVEHFVLLTEGRLLTVHRNWIEKPQNPDYELRVWDATSICKKMSAPAGDRPYTKAFFSQFHC